MESLRLCLSTIDEVRFKISANSDTGEGEIVSTLPFLQSNIDRLTTIIKTLDVIDFHTKDFQQDGEQDWMVGSGLLNEDRSNFHPNWQVNIGRSLYQALFPTGSEVEKILEKAITLAEARQSQLHIQFQFYADPVRRSRLTDFPWELLHDGQKFLAHDRVTFSRYVAHRTAPPELLPVEKVSVLLVSSTASDSENGLAQLSEKEKQAVHKGLKQAERNGHICLAELKSARLSELRAYLTEKRGDKMPHVLHFDGHGVFGKRCRNDKCRTIHKGIKLDKCRCCGALLSSPQGYLVFEDEKGKADYVSAQKFGALLQQVSFGNSTGQQQGIAVAVLTACKSGMALAGDSAFNGIAQNLISRQVPAVVAMQYIVSIKSATDFAEQFYRSLGQRNPLATAVSHAREAIGFEGNQWYRPVLYLRWKDNKDNKGGQLFAGAQAATSHNIKQVVQAVSEELAFVSSAQLSTEITRAVENYSKRTYYRKQAEMWLGDKNYRFNLASILADSTLEDKSLDIRQIRLLQEDKESFTCNIYNCLNWLIDALQAGKGKNTDRLKEYLVEHSIEPYRVALDILKQKAKEDLQDNRELINTIHRYINNLLARISF